MVKVRKINDKNIGIAINENREMPYPTKFFAAVDDKQSDLVVLRSNEVEIPAIVKHFSEFEVNGASFSNAFDLIIALNAFVGNFKLGGGSSPLPTNLVNSVNGETGDVILTGSNIKQGIEAGSLTINEALQRVEDIATGARVAIVFDTEQQMRDWLAGDYVRPDGLTPADLKLGEDMFIRDVDAPDFWWDGMQPLEQKVKVDLSDYFTKQQVIDRLAGIKNELQTEIDSKDYFLGEYKNLGTLTTQLPTGYEGAYCWLTEERRVYEWNTITSTWEYNPLRFVPLYYLDFIAKNPINNIFYLDSTAGNDSNNGKQSGEAVKTYSGLAQVIRNQKSYGDVLTINIADSIITFDCSFIPSDYKGKLNIYAKSTTTRIEIINPSGFEVEVAGYNPSNIQYLMVSTSTSGRLMASDSAVHFKLPILATDATVANSKYININNQYNSGVHTVGISTADASSTLDKIRFHINSPDSKLIVRGVLNGGGNIYGDVDATINMWHVPDGGISGLGELWGDSKVNVSLIDIGTVNFSNPPLNSFHLRDKALLSIALIEPRSTWNNNKFHIASMRDYSRLIYDNTDFPEALIRIYPDSAAIGNIITRGNYSSPNIGNDSGKLLILDSNGNPRSADYIPNPVRSNEVKAMKVLPFATWNPETAIADTLYILTSND